MLILYTLCVNTVTCNVFFYQVSVKVQQILDIWKEGLGVVSLHCFQSVIPVEAYTREACMVDAMGMLCTFQLKVDK